MKGKLSDPLGEALSSLSGWTAVVAAALVLGFCAGYWIGHGEVTGGKKTLGAFAWIPLLWLGNPEAFIAYAVTFLAWYLPLRYESLWLRVGAVAGTFVVWLIVIEVIVVKTAQWKFFRY